MFSRDQPVKTELPRKRSVRKALSQADKRSNACLWGRLILVEYVIGCLERLRILSDRYGNRSKRFGFRFNLIAAIHNFEL